MTVPAKAARIGSILLSVLALAAVPVLAGCGGGEEDSSTATTGTDGETAGTEDRNSTEEGQGKNGAEGGGSQQQGSRQQGSKQGGGSSGAKQGENVPQPEGGEEKGITPEQKREATTANIKLESPNFKGGTALPAKYTCDGKGTWPSLTWKGLPAEAEELVLLVLSVDPAEQKLLFDWAVAGLDPSLSEIEEGKLPQGAVVGENSFGKEGYEICPAEGTAQNYIFMLFAIPEALDPSPGFEARGFREEVLAQSGNVGLLNAPYKR